MGITLSTTAIRRTKMSRTITYAINSLFTRDNCLFDTLETIEVIDCFKISFVWYSFFRLGKNSLVFFLFIKNVTTVQVYFLMTNIDFLSVLVPVPFIYRYTLLVEPQCEVFIYWLIGSSTLKTAQCSQ